MDATQPIPEPRLLSADAVAEIVGLTAWGVKHLHRAHKLRGRVQGGRLYWHSADVTAYVESFRSGTN